MSRVSKARATVERRPIVLRTGGQIHSFLSLGVESGFGGILSFLSELSQVLCFGGGRVRPVLSRENLGTIFGTIYRTSNCTSNRAKTSSKLGTISEVFAQFRGTI